MENGQKHAWERVREDMEFLVRRWRLKRRFKEEMGYDGNFEDPKTCQEKVQFRKLYGNHEFYGLVADKYKVRQYVAEKAGEKYLIPLIGVYDKLSPELFESFPERFIVKANNGSKWHRIVHDKSRADIKEIIDYFHSIRNRKYSRRSFEKHYDFIEPKIVVEELLDDGGELPWDYNLFCYNGKNGFDYAITISSSDASVAGHFDRNWNVWESNLSPGQAKRYVDPENFGEMVEVARALSADFDFVRVDLYNLDGKIYFGELTCTPGSGLGPIDNEFRSRMRTEMWELDKGNARLYRKPQKVSLPLWNVSVPLAHR